MSQNINYESVGAQGYNNKSSLLAYRLSSRWLKDIENQKLTDMKQIICNDIPVLKDDTATQDKEVIGELSRNPIKKRTITKGTGDYQILMDSNFMNWALDIIQHTTGAVELPVNTDGTFRNVSLNSSSNFTIMSKTSTRPEQEFSIKLYKGSKMYHIYSIGNATFSDLYADLASKLDAITDVTASVVAGTNFISVSILSSDLFDDVVFTENICIGSMITHDSTLDTITEDLILDKTFQPILVRTVDESVAIGVARKTLEVTPGLFAIELVTGLDAVSLFSTATNELVVQTLSWINLDKSPIVKFDYMNRRAAGYDEEEKIATGAKVIRLMNSLGSAKINIPSDDDPSMEISVMGSKLRYVKPMEDDMSDATEKWKESVRTYGVREPRALYPSNITGINPTHGFLLTGTGASTVTDKVTFTLNGIVYTTGNLINPTSDDIGTAISNVINAIEGITANFDTIVTHALTITADNNSTPLKLADVNFGTHDNSPAIDYSNGDSVTTVLQVQFTDASSGNGNINIYLNGTKFSFEGANPSTTNLEVVQGLADLINLDEDYYAYLIGPRLTITRVDGREPLSILVEIKGDTDISLIMPASGFDSYENQSYPLALEISDDVKNVYMDAVKIGNTNDDVGSGCGMIRFCETADIMIDLSRDIQSIDSACNEDHRIGWSARDYQIYIDIETTDIEATKVFDKWDKFENQKTFPLYFVSVDSGIAMYFPACRFETLEEQERNTNQGHKYRLNVNFDPNKIPVIGLPQYLV